MLLISTAPTKQSKQVNYIKEKFETYCFKPER